MRDIIMIYGASVVTSIIYNSTIYYKVHRNSRKKVMKQLKFKGDLTRHTKRELREINKDFFLALLLGIRNSIIPGLNVAYSISNYECSDAIEEAFEEEYNYIVERANEKEEFARKAYLETLRELKDSLSYRDALEYVDDDIKNNIDNDQYRPSKKTFTRAVKSMVYGPKLK